MVVSWSGGGEREEPGVSPSGVAGNATAGLVSATEPSRLGTDLARRPPILTRRRPDGRPAGTQMVKNRLRNCAMARSSPVASPPAKRW
jgi:hypothetical protein